MAEELPFLGGAVSDASEAIILDLVGLFPGFGPVLAEHLEDNSDEMIPEPGDPGSGMRDMLGPSLREMDDWLQ